MLKRLVIFASLIPALAALTSAQYKFEGYNVIVDVPTTQTSTACAVRYVPPTTAITVTDVNGATPLRLKSCGGTDSAVSQRDGNTGSLRASATNYKWCFEGEDKVYRVSYQGDRLAGTITYNMAADPSPREKGFYNIRDFGAVGDGRTDDTPAFRGAMAAIASNNGGTLTIPDGDYIITAPIAIPSGLTMRGTNGLQSGAATSDLARKNPSRITLSGPNKSLFRIGECVEGVTISDIELYAQSNVNTNGIEAVGAYNTSQGFNFDRVIFHNFNRGINAYGLPQTNLNWQFDYVKIHGCRFVLNRDAGIFVNTRNTDWRISASLFANPRRQPGQNANAMHFERVGTVLIEDTFGGGGPGSPGGTFLNILDSGVMTLIGVQSEHMTNSLVYNEVRNPEAGEYHNPIMFINSIFGDPIIFNARRTIVSTGSLYGPNTWRADERVRVYSTGDRFCYDGYIMGCTGGVKHNFDKATILFMTGQPGEGSVPGHPTVFGTDVEFGASVKMPSFPSSALPKAKPDGTMVYCPNCIRSTTPCRPGGNGAPAMMVAGQWSCL
jgi:hypothetical protein